MTLYNGDCLEVMRGLDTASVDLVLTDPPYGISFMGKKWDHDVPGIAIWGEALRVLKPGGHLLAFAGTRTQHRMACNIEDAGFEIRDMIGWLYGTGFPKSGNHLKPAIEPITMARKPLIGTVAANVQKHGTGGLDIEACRVGNDSIKTNGCGSMNTSTPIVPKSVNFIGGIREGRHPANITHDGSAEVMRELGDYARFFYCAKPSKREREAGTDQNHHPTVKPIAIMRHLALLASSDGATVLDPFMGSGTTGLACKELGRDFIGIELDPEYFEIAKQRIENHQAQAEIA